MKNTKPRGAVWDHFSVISQGKNVLSSKVRCKYCPWEHLGHPGKMQAHLDNRCAGYAERSLLKPEVPAVQEGPSEAEEPFAKKPRTPIAYLVTLTERLRLLSSGGLFTCLLWRA